MSEDKFDSIKIALLEQVRDLFEEIESDIARSHEEKYALLEDSLEDATDIDELRVAFEQWYADHGSEMDLDCGMDEIWEVAVNG